MAAVNKSRFAKTTELATAIVASANLEVTDASEFKRHSFAISTTGVWVFHVQTSDDDGTTWVRATDDLTVATSTDSIFFVDAVNALRLVATRTTGAATVWVRQSDQHPTRW